MINTYFTILNNTPEFINEFLNSLGFNTTLGKSIIYIAIMLISIFIMVYKKVPSLIIVLIEVLLFGMFIYLGWVPIYIIITVSLAFLIGIFGSIKGGAN